MDGQDANYDVERFLAGTSTLSDREVAEVQGGDRRVHGLGEIVTAVSAAREFEARTEWLGDGIGARSGGVLSRGEDGRCRRHVGGQHLPVVYGLRARRP
jgi:hypothetical protein